MAQAATIKGTQLLIKVGDAASPEVFTHPCLINGERGIQFQSEANEVIIPDCSSPDDPAWKQVTKDGFSAQISGAGVLDTASIDDFDTWFRADTAKNVRVYVAEVGYWEGAFKLTEWGITGARGDKAQVSLTLVSDGVVAAFT
jgi:predicted secreted protein